ncbi:CBL-interacting serine/threonine-protein kinase 23 [Apostasia shenzhenica]|uniref:CBL-interacting serine/threonine-protein kinase 23 n=1 Tax=Apostasia shenzhenica TaxID=1088818 RepID=A0A2I0B883_9ASPA|nr:CBL-interacting serine/threonine-protein kinase 23 [Apostasia shenzhenica]
MASSGGGTGGYRGGRVVGDYMFGRQIGAGSFSVVWLARHRVHGVEVAVKEIVMEKLSKKLQESLLSEIVILKRIKHPNIIALHEIIEASRRVYLILEYCKGGDLSLYIQNHGRVPEATAKYFMQQLANGLQVLRENNLIHRDLKPQNLLLSTTDDNSVLKIADFGFARSLQPLGLAETLCGSPLYMAPEIMQLQKYDAKADLWSVGAILYQLVTGKTPFTGNTQIQLLHNIVNSNDLPFPLNINLSQDCIDLCKKLLRRNPVERLTFEEFFNHPFLSQSKVDDSSSQISSTECTPKRPSSYHEHCIPFRLEDVSCKPDRSLLAPRNSSPVRSTYGFDLEADKDSSGIISQKLGQISKSFSPNKFETSGFGNESYRQLSGDMKQDNDCSKGAKHDPTIVDSLELVDQDYVIVSGLPGEMPSSSLSIGDSRSLRYSSDCLPEKCQKSCGFSAPVPIVGAPINKFCPVGSMESQDSPASGTSQGSADIGDAFEKPPADCMTWIKSLQQYASVLSELVKEEIGSGRWLEAFSVQLVLLAVWKHALNICHTKATSAIEGSPSHEVKSQVNSKASPSIRNCFSSSNEFQVPDAVSSEIEREFLLSVELAEEIEKNMGQIDEAAEMPDAVEVIFQSALAWGRLGAVDEMMKNIKRAEAHYSKAACLLHFLLVEAPSLVLNPPVSLSNSDRYRLQTYIDMISNRHSQSRSQRMSLLKFEGQ